MQGRDDDSPATCTPYIVSAMTRRCGTAKQWVAREIKVYSWWAEISPHCADGLAPVEESEQGLLGFLQ